MSGIRLLDLVKPFSAIVPEVESPVQPVQFDEKIVYTVASVAIYLLLGLPLAGVRPDKIADPFGWLRGSFAATSGTLLEFGVLAAATSAFLWQVLAGLRIVSVDFTSRTDRATFQTLQKITTVVLSVAYGAGLLYSGYFTSADFFTHTVEGSSEIATPLLSTMASVLLQITGAGVVVSLMVEVLDKGYGFGPGILAFIGASSATNFVTGFIGLTTVASTRNGTESSGAIVQLVRNFLARLPFGYAILEAFERVFLTNLTQVYLAVFGFVVTVYLLNARLNISVKSAKVRSMVTNYPIKLLYCGALPLLFADAILYNLNILGFILFKAFPGCKYVGLFAQYTFESASLYQEYNLSGGLLYLLSPSRGAAACSTLAILRPFTYALYVVLTSYFFAKSWPAFSGSSPKDVAKLFKEQDIQIAGHRDQGAAKELQKVIPVASTTGTLLLSVLAATVEACGKSQGFSYAVIVGIVSSVTVLEQLMAEWQQSGASSNSQLAQFMPAAQ